MCSMKISVNVNVIFAGLCSAAVVDGSRCGSSRCGRGQTPANDYVSARQSKRRNLAAMGWEQKRFSMSLAASRLDMERLGEFDSSGLGCGALCLHPTTQQLEHLSDPPSNSTQADIPTCPDSPLEYRMAMAPNKDRAFPSELLASVAPEAYELLLRFAIQSRNAPASGIAGRLKYIGDELTSQSLYELPADAQQLSERALDDLLAICTVGQTPV